MKVTGLAPHFSRRSLVAGGAASLICAPALAANDKVTVAMTAGLADAPMIVAMERGYFKAENIDIEKVIFASASQTIVPLASKQIDVAGGSISAALYNGVDRNINIKAVADRSHTTDGIPYLTIFVRQDLIDSGRFKSLKDLKGLNFAIIAKGITVTALLEAGLRSAGLKMSDVDVIYMDYTKQVLALKNKALDVTIMGEPFATALVEDKVGVRFMNTNDYFPNYVVTVFLYGPSLLEDRREVGDRFMRALMRGMRDYNDALDDKGLLSQGNEDIISAFEREFRMTPKQLRSMFSHSVDPNGAINMKSVAIDWDFLVADGQISGKVKPDQLLDASFAQKAAASLGPYVRRAR